MSVEPRRVFLDELDQFGRSERTLEAYDRVLEQFEVFLESERDVTSRHYESASREDCLAWLNALRGQYSESTIATYTTYVNRFYRYMLEIGMLDANPMSLVVEEASERIETDPTRRDLSVEDLQSFMGEIHHPQHRALVMLLAKTGVRVGEAVNIDLRDLQLSTVDVEDHFDVLSRGQLVGRGPSLFVSSAPARGEQYNGEVRTASNKRQRDTIIPIDGELEATIVRWLAIRPDSTSPAEPLFVSTKQHWGDRLTVDQVRHVIRSYANSAGWYVEGAESGENVTPHYFRHFFTTHLRNRTGDRGVVKYLRGDVADDIIDTYTHNWGDLVQSTYQEHIYSLS
ncbi:MAG: tyrosine-type recombinase/integrase [Halobacteriales archaeon]